MDIFSTLFWAYMQVIGMFLCANQYRNWPVQKLVGKSLGEVSQADKLGKYMYVVLSRYYLAVSMLIDAIDVFSLVMALAVRCSSGAFVIAALLLPRPIDATPINATQPVNEALRYPVNWAESGTEKPSTDQGLRLQLQRLINSEGSAVEAWVDDEGAIANPQPFPSLGSPVFDAQLAGYIAYLETVGVPDILIVGSSRALQGIDPEVLQTRLTSQGYAGLKVYNFSVNGATAQVVNFILGELLPGRLPAVVVWGDGSRAFNDGRPDRTWEGLVSSPGYQAVVRGQQPAVPNLVETDDTAQIAARVAALGARAVFERTQSGLLDGLGFSAIGDRFDPTAYYRQFPRVSGRYDGAYSPFTLQGRQTVALADVAAVVQQQNSQLVFVNLPLSDSYLDEFRLYHEGLFQSFLQAQSDALGFVVVDLLTQWEGQPGFFADPSHINQYGAAVIADQLARDPELLLAITAPAASDERANSDAEQRDRRRPPSLESLLNGVRDSQP